MAIEITREQAEKEARHWLAPYPLGYPFEFLEELNTEAKHQVDLAVASGRLKIVGDDDRT